MHFDLPENVEYVLNTLQDHGYEAYIVGGCVRDLLCGKLPHDYDITTSALPEQIAGLFSKTVNTGIKHGTVTVIEDGKPIEVTTFRTESGYSDNRRPDNVAFVKRVDADLARRDFTVNAMCYNSLSGLIDLYGGCEDIKHRRLCAVGDAETRFREDALRILRLFRFAATLDFSIEDGTYKAALDCANLLENISAERIFCELEKAVLGKNASVLNPLLESGALQHLGISGSLPENFKNLPESTDLRIFTLLYHTCGNLSSTLKKLKCSNRLFEYCTKIADAQVPITKSDIKRLLGLMGEDIFLDYLEYLRHIKGLNTDNLRTLTEEIIKLCEPYKISQLDISGEDIANLGFSGEEIGKRLKIILDRVIDDPQLNKKENLIKLVSN